MKGKSIIIIIAVICALLGTTSVEAAKKVNLPQIQKWHDKYSVELFKGERAFCSGLLVGNLIYSAFHCCMPVKDNPEDFTFSFDGIKKERAREVQLDGNGNDVCRIAPERKMHSPIKVGSPIVADTFRNVVEKDYWMISRGSDVRNEPDIKQYEVQKVYRISLWEDDTTIVSYKGFARPGFSGSGILNSRGELVGIVVIGLPNDRGEAIEGIFGGSLLDLTEWFMRYGD